MSLGYLEVFLDKTVMHNHSLKEDVRSDCVDLILKGNDDHAFDKDCTLLGGHHTAGELESKSFLVIGYSCVCLVVHCYRGVFMSLIALCCSCL